MDALEVRLIENLSTVIVMLDSQRRVAYMNGAAEALFGRSKERAMGQPFSGLFPDDRLPDDIKNTLDHHAAFAQREAQWLLAYHQEATLLDYMISDVLQDDLRYRLLEIHPRDRLNRIQRDATLASDYQTTREVVRGLAHEIKNPLGGIRGAAQLLQRVTPPAQLEYTQVIIDEADRLRNLVDRMLGPVDSSQLATINIHRIIERVITLIEAERPDSILWHRDYDPSLPEFSGDPEQVQQVILNVVANAQQALTESPVDKPTITIKTRAGHQITLSGTLHRLVCHLDITDNGPGIPEALKPTLFYPMVSGRAQGSGLGLSLAQQYVSQQKGLIEFTSQPGHTCFTIMLPMEHLS
jgi:two-component system nitrogen regulation sensor histidine kinase GlnL